MSPQIFAVLIAVVIVAVLWKLLRGGLGDASFTVNIRGQTVTLKGQYPGKDPADVTSFIAGLELPEGAKFWAVPDGDELRLRFSPQIPDNLQQRIRNYFYN